MYDATIYWTNQGKKWLAYVLGFSGLSHGADERNYIAVDIQIIGH